MGFIDNQNVKIEENGPWVTLKGEFRGSLSSGNASSPDHSSGSKDNTHKERFSKDVGTGQEQQSSGLSCDATSGQDHKHPDPTELARHQPKGESGGFVAALDQGEIPGTGITPTHPSREGSSQGQPREPVAAPSLRVTEALVKESTRSYSAGRGDTNYCSL